MEAGVFRVKGHSRGNCCHGMHVITCDLLHEVHKLDQSDAALSAECMIMCICM
jgi:hypothetical protein